MRPPMPRDVWPVISELQHWRRSLLPRIMPVPGGELIGDSQLSSTHATGRSAPLETGTAPARLSKTEVLHEVLPGACRDLRLEVSKEGDGVRRWIYAARRSENPSNCGRRLTNPSGGRMLSN